LEKSGEVLKNPPGRVEWGAFLAERPGVLGQGNLDTILMGFAGSLDLDLILNAYAFLRRTIEQEEGIKYGNSTRSPQRACQTS
jgi:hypothetical protein